MSCNFLWQLEFVTSSKGEDLGNARPYFGMHGHAKYPFLARVETSRFWESTWHMVPFARPCNGMLGRASLNFDSLGARTFNWLPCADFPLILSDFFMFLQTMGFFLKDIYSFDIHYTDSWFFLCFATPKFAELTPPTSDTAKKVSFFYNIEPIERTFKFKIPSVEASSDTYPSDSEMSGVRRSSSKFALDDIDSMVSKCKAIKRETIQPVISAPKHDPPKPESSTPHSKLATNKKKKPADAAEAFEQMTKFHESLAKEAEGGKQMISDLQKIAVSKNKKYADVTKELSRVKAKLQDAYAQHA
ncbi:hypothetical protein L1987_20623 [Smallanthus sonchifolius]|uniref:Uncharacterized protein n=1 Tax=Smallanthus sonchifolius TaxID=185202 RepID=A0ACB9ITW5_9ASTR|nr:hypothetical protein L1987_20623 [Smallanthus sonchifolius]